jgi:hypothetical protein
MIITGIRFSQYYLNVIFSIVKEYSTKVLNLFFVAETVRIPYLRRPHGGIRFVIEVSQEPLDIITDHKHTVFHPTIPTILNEIPSRSPS